MNWNDLKGIVGTAAPILGTLLGGPAGTAVGTLISSVLGTENKPEEVSKILAANPELLFKLKEQENNQQTELQKLLIESEIKTLTEVNATMRTEIASGDKFKSYWRPLFGYIMATSWGGMMFAVTYQILFKPVLAANTITSLGQLTGLWAIGMAVLGINVWKRSNDKDSMLGISKVPLIGSKLDE